jgi:hypothetical protein
VPDLRDLPDVETLLVEYLKTDVALSEIVGAKVSSPDLPSSFKAEERVRFFYVGGSSPTPDTNHVENALLQFDCYGSTAIKAFDVARKTLSALLRSPAATFAGMVVTKAQKSLGPVYDPDPDTDAPRYRLDVILTVHATAG